MYSIQRTRSLDAVDVCDRVGVVVVFCVLYMLSYTSRALTCHTHLPHPHVNINSYAKHVSALNLHANKLNPHQAMSSERR